MTHEEKFELVKIVVIALAEEAMRRADALTILCDICRVHCGTDDTNINDVDDIISAVQSGTLYRWDAMEQLGVTGKRIGDDYYFVG